ncbi:MAG: serine hydrolase domain-containing protein, partial [Dehalococcoidia bacterium]
MLRAIRRTSTFVVLILAASATALNPGSVFGAAGSSESLQYPDTAAGRAFQQWLAALDADDVDALRAFHREYSPADEVEGRIARELQALDQTGGIDPYSIARSSEYELAIIGKTHLTEMWVEVSMALSPEPPHELTDIGLRPAETPAGVPSGEALTDDALRAELDRYIAKLAEAGVFSGTVLVARDGQPVYQGSAGMADEATGVANGIGTKYNLGSMNKMFTAIAIAQLVEQGTLSLDQPIGAYLSGLPPEIAETVTIDHLLTHTSGLGDFFGPEFEKVKDTLRAPRDYFPLFIDKPLRFEPGTDWSYSNGGFIVLGAIVEAASGIDYFD